LLSVSTIPRLIVKEIEPSLFTHAAPALGFWASVTLLSILSRYAGGRLVLGEFFKRDPPLFVVTLVVPTDLVNEEVEDTVFD